MTKKEIQTPKEGHDEYVVAQALDSFSSVKEAIRAAKNLAKLEPGVDTHVAKVIKTVYGEVTVKEV